MKSAALFLSTVLAAFAIAVPAQALAGDSAWVGAQFEEVGERAQSLGLDRFDHARIAGLSQGGPAQAAGLRQGDVIVSIDGESVSRQQLMARLEAASPGDRWQVEVSRDGLLGELALTLGQPPAVDPPRGDAQSGAGSESAENQIASPHGVEYTPTQAYMAARTAFAGYLQEDMNGDFELEGFIYRGRIFGKFAERHGMYMGFDLMYGLIALADDRPHLNEVGMQLGYFIEPVQNVIVYGAGGFNYVSFVVPVGTGSGDDDFSLNLQFGAAVGITPNMAVHAAYRLEPNDLIDQPILDIGLDVGPVFAGLRRFMDSDINQVIIGYGMSF
ncbi:PDZ domain-containing protein [Natronospira bacteriovora]|uniref:PDZ domain-containing protein n=1 Tax=Natronospira bacteriovora TaxID=3069753 RepID=A0ABU0W308_9GAMM|nr:PDZ domain-containing protein [Natronospira sp. AB-CW4]MDQ2068401.1 PDZ domain-containing protein [Natronospira sp. AB-CW4]